MRLLERNSAGEFTLTKDFINDNEVPPYAILSHTWVEGEEITFEDLTNNTGKQKLGVAYQAYRDRTSCGVLQQLPARQLLLPKLSKVSFVYKELHGSRATLNGVLAP
jgi:hypothetical protein